MRRPSFPVMRVLAGAVLGAAAVLATASALAIPADPTLARQLEPSEIRQQGFVQVAGLFGDSEEEKAAAQREQNQDATIRELQQRQNDLEETVRRQTGQNEELTHRVQELSQKIDRMRKDFDYKICSLTAQQMGADASTMDCTGGDGSSQAMNSGAPVATQAPPSSSGGIVVSSQGVTTADKAGAPAKLGAPPGVLGTLPATASASPSASPARAEFDSAMDLLKRAQNSEARAAFRSFADQHPKDDLAPQALYWVGSIAYAQKDYDGAKQSFAEGLKKYPDSPRAADSMLKLGQSFLALNQKNEGCTTLGLLSKKFPNASAETKQKAVASRKAAGCK